MTAKPTLARWRTGVALWLLAWVLLVVAVVLAGVMGLIAAMIAFGLGKYGGPSDWNRR